MALLCSTPGGLCQLTKHAALEAVLCEWPKLVLPHRITAVTLPRKPHHLRERAGDQAPVRRCWWPVAPTVPLFQGLSLILAPVRAAQTAAGPPPGHATQTEDHARVSQEEPEAMTRFRLPSRRRGKPERRGKLSGGECGSVVGDCPGELCGSQHVREELGQE